MKGTDEIRTYSFDNDGLNELKSFEYGKNWPVVYLIHNNKDLYIRETTSAEVRMSQHLSNNEKNYLEESEKKINLALNQLIKDRIVLMVTHRTSSFEEFIACAILVINNHA